MLIIGGLIALAVVALLLAFFLARGDSGSERRRSELANKQAQTELTAAQAAGAAGATAPVVDTPRTTERQPEFISANNNSRAAYDGRNEETVLPRSGVSLPNHYYDEDTSIQSLNRQVYELAGQLRSLQRQSQEIEQTLIELSGAIEGLDQRGRHNTAAYASGNYGTSDNIPE
ncbi:hypothetical protein [Dictyobacter kobayashii]|uniref:Uncharacterized protein n=1 Tax=Dictyobacter kobayashii TaxID=2014872 RepID=A0A402AHJ1_9CHLR|nr:hypothetical protein [Dictyobacter kobayashii]GCE18580.1 hypothetical protein KDK_23800 [Dictyobacter kobayashii]